MERIDRDYILLLLYGTILLIIDSYTLNSPQVPITAGKTLNPMFLHEPTVQNFLFWARIKFFCFLFFLSLFVFTLFDIFFPDGIKCPIISRFKKKLLVLLFRLIKNPFKRTIPCKDQENKTNPVRQPRLLKSKHIGGDSDTSKSIEKMFFTK